jgi:hypothetical protein
VLWLGELRPISDAGALLRYAPVMDRKLWRHFARRGLDRALATEGGASGAWWSIERLSWVTSQVGLVEPHVRR